MGKSYCARFQFQHRMKFKWKRKKEENSNKNVCFSPNKNCGVRYICYVHQINDSLLGFLFRSFLLRVNWTFSFHSFTLFVWLCFFFCVRRLVCLRRFSRLFIYFFASFCAIFFTFEAEKKEFFVFMVVRQRTPTLLLYLQLFFLLLEVYVQFFFPCVLLNLKIQLLIEDYDDWNGKL